MKLIERAFVHGAKIIRSPEGDRWTTTSFGDKVVKSALKTYPMSRPEGV